MKKKMTDGLLNEESCVNPPITLYLIGLAGTGKYTIAKKIANSGYKIVDNHLINNSIFSLLALNGKTPVPETAWEAIKKIRDIVCDFISQDFKTNFIFTNELLESDEDRAIYMQIQEAAKKRRSLFVPVRLLIQPEELRRRMSSSERKLRFKTTNPEEAMVKKELIKIDHPYLMEIDVTDLSPAQAARTILNFVEAIKNETRV